MLYFFMLTLFFSNLFSLNIFCSAKRLSAQATPYQGSSTETLNLLPITTLVPALVFKEEITKLHNNIDYLSQEINSLKESLLKEKQKNALQLACLKEELDKVRNTAIVARENDWMQTAAGDLDNPFKHLLVGLTQRQTLIETQQQSETLFSQDPSIVVYGRQPTKSASENSSSPLASESSTTTFSPIIAVSSQSKSILPSKIPVATTRKKASSKS